MRRARCVVFYLAIVGTACSGASPTTTPSTSSFAPSADGSVRETLEARFADAISGIDDRETVELLERVKENTIGFADPAAAEAAGYRKSPNGCTPGAGIHYINRDLVDDVTGTDSPEVLIYAIEESGPRLVGVEYFIPGTRIDPIPDILGRAARGPTVIPSVGSIYWHHVWLYDKPSDGLFASFHPLVGCWEDD